MRGINIKGFWKMGRFKKSLIKQLLALGLLASSSHADSFFKDHARGWHWYEFLPLPEEEDPTQAQEQAPQAKVTAPAPKTPSELVKAYREELENRLHRAWVDPTHKNIKAYQEMQKDMMDRSKVFSHTWLQTVFQNPELDHTLVSPVNQQARHLQLDLEKDRTRKTIKSLSEENGLFFFFAGDCPHCHTFAPVVKRFSELYGWNVIAISVDGGSLPEFPDAQSDNGLFKAWEVKVLPSLYAVNPATKTVIPVAYGVTAMDEMENRIMTLVGDQP